jgi:hypothetical protein
MAKYTGELEIDEERGVIYFHFNNEKNALKIGAATLLRVCSLPKPIPEKALDITHMKGCNWE